MVNKTGDETDPKTKESLLGKRQLQVSESMEGLPRLSDFLLSLYPVTAVTRQWGGGVPRTVKSAG